MPTSSLEPEAAITERDSGAGDTYSMRGRLTSSRFVGRQNQLVELQRAFHEASEGKPGLALLSGDSGVGKTRLVTEVTASLEDALVLRGECLEQGEIDIPYAPLLGALRPLVREQDPTLEALSAGSRANLATLLPSLGVPDGPAPAGAGEGTGQARLFESLLELLHLLSEKRPLVVVLEDMHWADSSTRAFTVFLSRSLSNERILLLLTYRSDELHRRHPLRPLLAELSRIDGCRWIELEPFDRGELEQALGDILGKAPEQALIDLLLTRTDGNPLYVEELLAAAPDGRGATPQSLREAFMLRIDRLGEIAGRAARAVAVGRTLDEATIARVTGLDDATLREALREAVAENILVTTAGDDFSFRHALLREAVYDDLLPGERGAMHLELARTFEMIGNCRQPEAEVAREAAVATHYAAAGDQAAALRATVLAAQGAVRVHAYGEAAELTGRALELWPRVPDAASVAGLELVELLEDASVAYALAGDLRRSEMLAQQALEGLDPDKDPLRYGRILVRRGRSRWRLNQARAAMADAQRALELMPEDPSAELAKLLSWIARTEFLRGHYREAISKGERALELAKGLELPILIGEVLNTLGMARISLGEVDTGEAMLRDAIRLAREQDDMDDLATAYSNLSEMLNHAGRIKDGVAVIEEGHHEVQTRFGRAYSWMEMSRAAIAFEAGDWDTARLANGPAVASQEGVGLIFRLLRDAELALGEGRQAFAQERLGAAEPLVQITGEAQWHGLFGSLLGEARRRVGALEGAQLAIARALDELEVCTDDVTWIARSTAVGLAVEADRAVRARDLREPDTEADAVARARIHLDRLEAAAEEGGPIEHAWFAVGGAENARARGANEPELWAAAAASWDALHRPYCAALMRLRQAEALVESDDRAAAAAVAATALAVGDSLGAGWLVGELRGLATRARLDLDAGGAQADADGSAGSDGPGSAGAESAPFGLTPRELQVLALIAEGASNRQIGTALFMAEKTASVHVSRILAKLEVQSRTQAAAVAHRLHLT